MSDVVSTSATTYPVTLADVKAALNVSTTYDDDFIQASIEAATNYVSERTNRAYVTETRTLKMDGFGDRRYVHDRIIYLPTSPLASVTSILYTASDGTANTTLSTTAYSASTGETPGRIFETYNNVWPTPRDVPDNVTITYTCGYGSTQSVQPPQAVHAIKYLAAHWYRNREPVSEQPFRDVPLTMDSLLGSLTVPDYG